MKEKIKKHWQIIIIVIFIIWLFWSDSNPFWLVLLSLGIGVYLILTKPIPKKIIRIISITIWISVFIVSGLLLYVNYFLPHGPSYPTGDVICRNDDRGPCGEAYVEDVSGLDIPNWAKFLRKSEGMLFWAGLIFMGIIVTGKNKD